MRGGLWEFGTGAQPEPGSSAGVDTRLVELLPVVGAGAALAVLALLALLEFLRVSGRGDHRAARGARLALLPLLILFGLTAALGLRGLLAPEEPPRTGRATPVTSVPAATGPGASVPGDTGPRASPTEGFSASPTEGSIPPSSSATPSRTDESTSGPSASGTAAAAGRTCTDEDPDWRTLPVPGSATDGVFTDLVETVTLSGTAEGSISFNATVPVRAVIVRERAESVVYRFRPPATIGEGVSTVGAEAAPDAIAFCYRPPG